MALAAYLDIKAPVYSGFSAGGLAAYLAAQADPGAQAYLGLDAVDSGGLAKASMVELPIPALFIVGAPSACNSRNNFGTIISRGAGYYSLPLHDASHCDFEWPIDQRCYLLCRAGNKQERDRVQQTIRESASEWLLDLSSKGKGGNVNRPQ